MELVVEDMKGVLVGLDRADFVVRGHDSLSQAKQYLVLANGSH